MKNGCPRASRAVIRSEGSYLRRPCKRSIASPAEWSTCCITMFCMLKESGSIRSSCFSKIYQQRNLKCNVLEYADLGLVCVHHPCSPEDEVVSERLWYSPWMQHPPASSTYLFWRTSQHVGCFIYTTSRSNQLWSNTTPKRGNIKHSCCSQQFNASYSALFNIFCGRGPNTLSIMAMCSKFSWVWNSASPLKQSRTTIRLISFQTKRRKIEDNNTEHSSTRMQPTLHMSHG